MVFTKRVRRTLFNVKYWKLKFFGSEEEYQLLIDHDESTVKLGAQSRRGNDSVRSELFTPTTKPSFSESLKSTGVLGIN